MPAKILLVEDDPDQATLFAGVLELCGYTVVTVANAEEAQRQLVATPFSLLLADWDLGGGMHGDALIEWARAQYPEIKTVLFSNHLEVERVAAASGADAAFRKIEGIAPLRKLVARLLPPAAGCTPA